MPAGVAGDRLVEGGATADEDRVDATGGETLAPGGPQEGDRREVVPDRLRIWIGAAVEEDALVRHADDAPAPGEIRTEDAVLAGGAG